MLILDAVSPLEKIQLSGALAVAVKTLASAISALQRVKLTREVADILAKLGAGADVATDDGLSDDPNSPNYRYRDTGYIADSRKEKAADTIRLAKESGQMLRKTDIDWTVIEQNPRQAKELIVKNNLFGKVDWAGLESAGMAPGAGFLIDRVYASIAPSPSADTPSARQSYALGLETLRARLESVLTVDQVMDVLGEIRQELDGTTLNADESDRYQLLRDELEPISDRLRELGSLGNDLYAQANEARSEAYRVEREFENRKKRGWKVDISHAQAVLDAKDKAEQVWKQWGDVITGKKDEEKSLEAQRKGLYQQLTDVERNAKARNIAESPTTQAWLTFGERFFKLLHYRSYKGSDSFAGHVTNAKAGRVKDWSWADKERAAKPREATKQEVTFQLRVADSYNRKGGKPVEVTSTHALKEMLGFRDVQSGNWVLKDPNSAKFHVEQTAAAMSDMADVLGIDAHHLGLGGRLGMAFGARGTGGKGAARAHYEPILRVVNLTKMGGGGALGHELLHAIDNILPSIINMGEGGKEQFASVNPEILPDGQIKAAFVKLNAVLTQGSERLEETIKLKLGDKELAKRNVDKAIPGNMAGSILRAGNAERAVLAVRERYAGTKSKSMLKDMATWVRIAAAYYAEDGATEVRVKTGRTVSSFLKEAQVLDGGTDGKYWSTTEELAARAFQSYLEDKLAADDRQNDYLSVYADNKYHYDAMTDTQWNPYPAGEERTRINAVFDELFAVLRDEKVFEKATGNKALLDSIFGSENLLDDIGGAAVAHADESALPMDKDIRTILKAAQEFAIANFANKRVTNLSDGTEIMIEKSGIMHGLSKGAGLTDALVATDLLNLLKNATFMRKEPDRKGRTEILSAYRYGAVVEVQGKPIKVGVIVREHRDGHRYYDHYELKPRNV